MKPWSWIVIGLLFLGVSFLLVRWLIVLVSAEPESLGVRDGRLAACPNTPNCVSTSEVGAEKSLSALPSSGTASVTLLTSGGAKFCEYMSGDTGFVLETSPVNNGEAAIVGSACARLAFVVPLSCKIGRVRINSVPMPPELTPSACWLPVAVRNSTKTPVRVPQA